MIDTKEFKFYPFSLGCKVNGYETSAVGEGLREKGFLKAESPEEADVIILNTCGVTARADQKSRQHISRFRNANPKACLLVMGCYSQANAETAASLGADIVLGSSEREEAVPLILDYLADHKKRILIHSSVRHEAYDELGTVAVTEAARAYLKIQDGCDNFCSYCMIPQLRGNSRSRSPIDVIREAKALTTDGYKEIVITGIHVGGYGKDLSDGSYRLSDLLRQLLMECPSLYRLRVSSIEESEIDDGFLSLLRDFPNLADHLHIPLQSGSSSILKLMKRKYDTKAFLDKLARIRQVRPEIAITTDVIAGFPTETEEHWKETVAFCREANFAEIHVFPFSSRPGTYASTLPDVDPQTKKERVHELLALSKELRLDYQKKFYGREMEVLLESEDKEHQRISGHTSNYLLVSIPSGEKHHGEIQKVIYSPSIASD